MVYVQLIYLDSKQFWDAFWRYVSCMRPLSGLVTFTDTTPRAITDSR